MFIRGKELLVPLIQGGMGVGVSLSRLAGNVAKCDCMGIISAADVGFKEDDFWQNPKAADMRALKSEIERAREIAGGHGLIGINAMVAGDDYAEIITTAVENGVDCIISGAGLPSELPSLVGDSPTAIAPIVSSGKAAAVITKLWDRHYKRIPDFIVVEGPLAGGHLGFNEELILSGKAQSLEEILPDVLNAIKPFEDKYNRTIPVFAAGGIYTHEDVQKFIKLGASGVQVATRFIATYECDASDAFKSIYLNIKKEDIEIIKSPVGM
ncbi:MAG: nitronate monooxygenase family protein, partial [Oscillospiraceae bacterium]